jgi:predicted alpha/beta hydrolase
MPLGIVIEDAVELVAEDGYRLGAHYFHQDRDSDTVHRALVVINPATAVKASYYHRFARFLAAHGLSVLTYDYRGIGASRYGSLRAFKRITNTDWGRLDCEAALAWSARRCDGLPLYVVAHSIGGMTVGLAPSIRHVARCLTVGAQFAYWRDYARTSRLSMWLRWHLAMPLLTAGLGYFPAKSLGWHEDLPAGAAYEWAFRGECLRVAPEVMRSFEAMTGEILALDITDDPFGTPSAVNRLLSYFRNARRYRLSVAPASVGEPAIGHFGYFHDRFRNTLWRESLQWLNDGSVPGRAPVSFNPQSAD